MSRRLPALVPYVVLMLDVWLAGTGRWDWFALAESVSFGAFVVWMGTPAWRIYRRARTARQ